MSRASTRTLIPLDTFAKIVGIHPLHFNQVYLPEWNPAQDQALAPVTLCGQPLVQYSWQTAGAVGREEIAAALKDAEDKVATHLGYSISPEWTRAERVDMPKSAYNKGSIQAKRGYLLSGGIEATSLVEAGASIVYSDSDADGYNETATVQVNTLLTEPQELALYYPGHAGDSTWEIRPLKSITISGGVATLVARREQLVLEALQESLTARGVDGEDDASFLTTVDVYRHYNDPSQQVRNLWNAGANFGGWCDCGLAGCVACTQDTQFGCLQIKLARQGIFTLSPGVWNPTAGSFDSANWNNCRMPDMADIWYYAGWRDTRARWPNLEVDPVWARAVSFLALTLLDRPMCGCDSLEAYMQHWRDDMASTSSEPSGGSQSFRVSPRLLNNPLGTSRAALNAWQQIVKSRLGEAVENA